MGNVPSPLPSPKPPAPGQLQEPPPLSMPASEEEKAAANELFDLRMQESEPQLSMEDLDESLSLYALLPDALSKRLTNTIQDTAMIPAVDPMALPDIKRTLMTQLIRLKQLVEAAELISSLESKEAQLPKEPNTGHPDMRASERALREYTFFANRVKQFGMLLIYCPKVKTFQETDGGDFANRCLRLIADRISTGINFQHILFGVNKLRLCVLCAVNGMVNKKKHAFFPPSPSHILIFLCFCGTTNTEEKELVQNGDIIVDLISTFQFAIDAEKTFQTSVAIGASIFDRSNEKFDFREWMKQSEIGLHGAFNGGSNNTCFVSSDSDMATLQAGGGGGGGGSGEAQGGAQSRGSETHRPGLSMLASAASSKSLGGNTGNLKLSANAIRESTRLYDKLQRMNNPSKDTLPALSILRILKRNGASFNYQNPRVCFFLSLSSLSLSNACPTKGRR